MEVQPLFTSLTTSARQLCQLLRCICFAPKAEVQITSQGLRFSVEETRVIQGLAFLESSLFSTFSLNTGNEDSSIPSFQISLPALLETLQVFGISDTGSSWRHPTGAFASSYATAFNTPALAIGGTCRISYSQIGAPLSITISEAGVTTTCELVTYEPPASYEEDERGIPLQRNALCLKAIMRSTWLHDAISELSSTNPTILILSASNTTPPYFILEGHGGPFGDSTVDFTPDLKRDESGSSTVVRGSRVPSITETFQVAAPAGSSDRVKQRYKFDLVKKAERAMAIASKVSIRIDRQGVLSMQFMIEVGEQHLGGLREAGGQTSNGSTMNISGTGAVSFVDFRLVPLVGEDDEEEEDDDDGGSTEEGNDGS